MVEENESREKEKQEFDLAEIYNKIWLKRKFILKIIVLAIIIGIVSMFTTPKIYKSETILLIESGGMNNMGGASSLLQQYGGLIGLNVKDQKDALTPELYPDIINKTPFLIKVLNEKIILENTDSLINLSDYFSKHTKSPLIGQILSFPLRIFSFRTKSESFNIGDSLYRFKNGYYIISQSFYDQMRILSGSINAYKGSSQENLLIITTELQDPSVTVQLNNLIVKHLQSYIIEYRTQKAKNDLDFLTNRHLEAEKTYINTQQKLATFIDKNKNVILSYSKTEEDRLRNEYNLAFNVYNTLSQQLEQAKLKVQENTPVFKVLDPAIYPLKKYKPQKISILFTSIFIGFFISVFWILVIDKIKYKVKK